MISLLNNIVIMEIHFSKIGCVLLVLCVSLIYFIAFHNSGYMVEIEDCENRNK